MRASRAVPRIAAFQQVRRFHQTRPAPFMQEVLDASTGFINGVHSVSHLPWVLSLPLTALIIRMTVAMPLQIFTKVNHRKEQDLSPILLSWSEYYKKKIRKTVNSPDFQGNQPVQQAAPQLLYKEVKQQQRTLQRRWGVARFYRPATALQLPVWISIMEGLRAMSGVGTGLIPYLYSLVTQSSSAATSEALNLAVEPSLANEGALWFPDLLAGDPTGILPAVLTVSILVNVRNGWKVPSAKSTAELPRTEMLKQSAWRGLRYFIQLLALNIGISSYLYEMPTALLIYWISSSNIATLQSFLLEKYMFPTPSLKPWRRVQIRYGRRGENAPSLKN